jgi:hypothetical protein
MATDLLIDEPSPFDTLATWEEHLAFLKSLPKDTGLRSQMLEEAHYWIERKKNEAK